jgi:hypothetical protein
VIVLIAIVAGVIFIIKGKSKKPPKEWKEPPKS